MPAISSNLETIFDNSLGLTGTVVLFAALLIACGFEFVNGFHDTANAVATVIYTNSLEPWKAVVWSGLWNFAGVFVGGISVAMAIVNLLPVELLVASGSNAGLAMVMALLLSAIAWNLGTWYLGLPASSSHTLIGAILGVGLANSMLPGHVFGSGVNWHKAAEVGLSLLVSPFLGFSAAYLLLRLTQSLIRNRDLFQPPPAGQKPPTWIRGVLIATCTGVSFAHGSNDGQKGVGLIMLILIGILPVGYAVNGGAKPEKIAAARTAVERLVPLAERLPAGEREPVLAELADLRVKLSGVRLMDTIPGPDRFQVRKDILLIENSLRNDPSAKLDLRALRAIVDYAPTWVLIAVACSLGIGTTVGWQRIVKTVGEKIGKQHLTYAQGASAELVAMATVGFAAFSGFPVSTTHVLSSGIAGTMVAQRSGLQMETVKKIGSAWLLTLPASMTLAAVIYLALRYVLVCVGCVQ